MNAKRGMFIVLLVLMFLMSAFSVSAAICQFKPESTIVRDVGSGAEVFQSAGENPLVGVVWGSVDNAEYIATEFVTLNTDCSLTVPGFNRMPTQTRTVGDLNWAIEGELGGEGDGDFCPDGHDGMTYIFVGTPFPPYLNLWSCESGDRDLVYPIPIEIAGTYGDDESDYVTGIIRRNSPSPGEVVVGFGGGVSGDNDPTSMVLEVWNISKGFPLDSSKAFRFVGMLDDTGYPPPEEMTVGGMELFEGAHDIFSPRGELEESNVPLGYVLTGIGTRTKDSGRVGDRLDGIRYEARKVLVDADGDSVWDNPDEENRDKCVDYDAGWNPVPTDEEDVLTQGEFAGCSCAQINAQGASTNFNCLDAIPGDMKTKTCGDAQYDLGEIAETSDKTSLICLNKQVKLMTETGVASPDSLDTTWKVLDSNLEPIPDKSCSEWCWVRADGDARAHIYTIQKGNNIYDVISTGNRWVACSGTEGPLSSNDLAPDLAQDANRFYCYQEGTHWSFADCRHTPPSSDPPKGLKDRIIGDGLFALPLIAVADSSGKVTSYTLNMDKIKSIYVEEKLNPILSGDTYLNFFVKFTSKLQLPVDIHLKVGPGDGGIPYINQDVLSYAINNPQIVPEKWIQVKVPLPNSATDIQLIRLDASGGNTITVKNMFFGDLSPSPVCSGMSSDDEEKSVWFENADFFDPDPYYNTHNAEALCNALYSVGETKAWLGKEVPDPARRCCGNNDAGSYVGIAGGNGCWNSQVVSPGETIFTVQIESQITEPDTTIYNYPCTDVTCIYPLPVSLDNSPAKFRNPHSRLYDLYYVYRDADANDIELPLGSEFKVLPNFLGNLVARRVSSQVLYLNDPSKADEQGFYGCNAPGWINPELSENLNYCAHKGDKYCSPTAISASGEPLVSSWVNFGTELVGYDRNALPGLQLREELFTRTNWDSAVDVVLPARNFLPNSNLLGDGIPYWSLISADGNRVNLNQRYRLDSSVNIREVTVGAGERFISNLIPVEPFKQIYFSQRASNYCSVNVIRINRDGYGVPTTEFQTGSSAESQGVVNTGDSAFLRLEFFGNNCKVLEPLLQYVDAKEPITTVAGSAVPAPPDTHDFRSPLSCCPQNYCWNGYVCVEPMNEFEFTQLTEPTTEDRNYRCIDGQWKDMPKRANWGVSDTGFCAQESQCFVTSQSTGESAAEFLSDPSKVPGCINDGEYLLDHYCAAGDWTSRTKWVVLNLTGVLENSDEYVLYCTKPQDALADMSVDGHPKEQNILGGAEGCLLGTFPEVIKDPNTCINNVCVLKYKDGREWKVAFATTLNTPFNEGNTFLKALTANPPAADVACPGEGDFVRCDLGRNFNGRVWYSPRLNALIYAQDDLPLQETLGSQFWDWLRSLFGVEGALSDEEAFVHQAQDFKDIYLSSFGSGDSQQKVRAVKEILAQDRTIIAEYENFDTLVCEYTPEQRITIAGFGTNVYEAVQNHGKIACTVSGNIQRVEAIADPTTSDPLAPEESPVSPLDSLWPQLTGKLRRG